MVSTSNPKPDGPEKQAFIEHMELQPDTVLVIPGQAEPFHHTDRDTLRKIGEPTPNPAAQAAAMKPGKTRT